MPSRPPPPPPPPLPGETQARRTRQAQRARRSVLAEWRGIDLTAQEKAWASASRSAADLVPKVLAGWKLEQKQEEGQIVNLWRQIVDPAVAAHAQPVGLRRGTLFVAVDSNVWLDEILRYRRKELLDRLQTALGSQMIQRISFRCS